MLTKSLCNSVNQSAEVIVWLLINSTAFVCLFFCFCLFVFDMVDTAQVKQTNLVNAYGTEVDDIFAMTR